MSIAMGITMTIYYDYLTYLMVNINPNIIITKHITILNTNNLSLKKHSIYFSYQRCCRFANSSYSLQIP